MPFGKYKGDDLTDVPAGYLGWLADQDTMAPDLRRAVALELVRRFDPTFNPPPPKGGTYDPHNVFDGGSAGNSNVSFNRKPPLDLRADMREVVEAGYKSVALRRHPDRGGSHEGMARLNRVVEELRRMLA